MLNVNKNVNEIYSSVSQKYVRNKLNFPQNIKAGELFHLSALEKY